MMNKQTQRLDASRGWQLSDTPRGKKWLENFERQDRKTARRLVDALQIYRADVMDLQLMEKVQFEIENKQIETPVAITIANSLEDFKILRNDPTGKRTRIYKGKPANLNIEVVFETFDPGGNISSLPGSEGGLGTAVRDYLKRSGNGVYFLGGTSKAVNYSKRRLGSIDQLRAKKIRTILVLADFSATGDQVETYVRTIARHPSVASWRSLKRTKLVVLAHTLTSAARNRLNRPSCPVDALMTIMNAPTIDSIFPGDEENREVKALCRKYATRPNMALGYRSSGALFLTTRSVPNNLPQIFLHKDTTSDGSRKGWNSLFASRTFPGDLAKFITGHEIGEGEGKPPIPLRLAGRTVGNSYKSGDIAKPVIAFLDFVSNRPNLTRGAVYETIPWDRQEIDEIVAHCERWGLLQQGGPELTVTSEGLHALYSERQRRSQKVKGATENIDMKRHFYYPRWS